MCGRGRAGVRQERTAQYGGRMFVFATTQGVQGDMPSAIAPGALRKTGKSARTVGGVELLLGAPDAAQTPHRRRHRSQTHSRSRFSLRTDVPIEVICW